MGRGKVLALKYTIIYKRIIITDLRKQAELLARRRVGPVLGNPTAKHCRAAEGRPRRFIFLIFFVLAHS